MDKRVLRERMRKKQQQIRRRQMMKKGAYVVAVILVLIFVIRGIILPVINRAGGGNTENMPVAEITADIFNDGQTDLMSIIVQAGLAASKSEARRAMEQGGVSVNGEKITDVKKMFTPDDFAEEFVLKKGKKNFRKVVYKA